MPIREDIDPPLTEKIIDICNIPPKKVQSVRVVVLHRLRHIDHPDLPLVVQHIVLRKIGVDQLALLVQNSHDLHHLKIDLGPLLNFRDLCIFQARSVLHVFPYEVHHQNVSFDQQSNGTHNDTLHTLQISHLFLSPHGDHLSGVARTVPSPKPKLSLNVSITILEYQNGSFVYLYRVLFFCGLVDCVVNICLLSRREAAVDFSDDFVVEQFQQNSSSSFVQNLLNSCSIGLIFRPFLFGQFFLLTFTNFIVNFVQIDLRVQFGICVLVIGLYTSL